MNISVAKTGEAFGIAMNEESSVTSSATSLSASYSSGPWVSRHRLRAFLN